MRYSLALKLKDVRRVSPVSTAARERIGLIESRGRPLVAANAVGGPQHINPAMGAKEWSLIGGLSILWGGSFFFIGVVVAEVPPFTVVFARSGLAATALLGYLWLRHQRIPAPSRLWAEFLFMGALNGLVPYTLIVWGQKHIASGLASVLNSTTPLFSVVLAHFLTSEERMTTARLGGILLGLGGVVVLTGPDAMQAVMSSHALGQFAVLGAALCYGFAGIYGRRFAVLSPADAAAGQIIGTTVLVLPLALLLEQPWNLRPSATTCWALIGLGLLSTALAYLLFFRILAVAGPTNVWLVNFLVPISALALGTFILGERPGWTVFAGLALIVTGIVAIDGRLLSYAVTSRTFRDS